MPIPNYFFYTLTQSAKKFQKTITGNADFSRIIQGYEDFWISPQNLSKLHPKKIMLDSSVVIDTSFEYRNQLLELLKTLDTHHFDISIEFQNEFYLLESRYFEDYCDAVYFPEGAPLISWNQNQTLCLDIYDIQCCFQEIFESSFGIQLKNSYRPWISKSVLEKFKTNPQTQEIENTFNSTSPENSANLEFYHLSRDNFESFVDTELNKVHNLICTKITFNEAIKKKIATMKIYELDLLECNMEDKDYSFLPKTITYLKIGRNNITESVLIQILAHLVNLKSLEMSFFMEPQSLPDLNFRKIVKLKLTYNFDDYLKWFPEIRYLDYSYANISNPDLFKHLVVLISYDENTQHRFLKANSNLKLNAPLEINDLNYLRRCNEVFSYVQALNIDCSCIDGIDQSGDMQKKIQIHSIFPRLNTLTINFNVLEFLKLNINFKNLKNLNLEFNSSQSSNDNLKKLAILYDFLSENPLLESVNFCNQQNQLLAFDFWKDKTLYFKTIFFDFCQVYDFNEEFFIHFLSAAPFLESLNISDDDLCVDIDFELDSIPKYPSLKHLSLSSYRLYLSDLIKLLRMFPELVRLELHFSYLEIDDLDFIFPHLPKLKTINSKVHLYNKIVFSFLESAPNLDEKSKEELLSLMYEELDSTSSQINSTFAYSESLLIDAEPDPTYGPKEYYADKMFSYVNSQYDTDVSLYRFQTYEKVLPSEQPCKINQVFTISSLSEDEFINIDIPQKEEKKLKVSESLNEIILNLKSSQIYFEDTKEEDMLWSTFVECFATETGEDFQPTTTDTKTFEQACYELSDLNILEKNSIGFLVKGSIKLLGKTGWQPLPSLSPNEELLCYESKESTPLEFKYSRRDNLYYVKTLKINTQIEIYLFIPNPLDIESVLGYLPSKFADFLFQTYWFYKKFGQGKLDIDPSKEYTGLDYIDLLNKKAIGSCRHRAILFKHLMSQNYPEVPCRIVINKVHAFIEIHLNNYWYTLDLGGYEAVIKYSSPIVLECHLPASEKALLEKNSKENLTSEHINQGINQFTEQLLQLNPAKAKIDFNFYIQQLLAMRSDKRLIECDTHEELECLQYGIQKAFIYHQYPFYYAHKPDDLHCQGKTFHLLDDESVEIKQNSHPLLVFLLENQTGCLIINYDTFSPEEYVAYNEMLDDKRVLHRIPIPPQINIIALRLKNKFVPENDFYSRFKTIENFPLNLVEAIELPFATTSHVMETAGACHTVHPIQLFNSPDWENILVGKWHINSKGWWYQKGTLIQAIDEGIMTIVIQNGPWDNQEFRHFWKQLTINNHINFAGRKLLIPNDINFCSENGYDPTTYFQFEQIDETENYHILNPYSYLFFFQNYHLDGETLIETGGYIQNASSHLSILISEPITRDQWARLVFHCKKQQLKLHVAIAPSVDIHQLSFIECKMPVKQLKVNHTQLIRTNDVDGLLEEYSNDYIIDVSELDESELIRSIVVKAHHDEFSFSYRQGFLDRDLAGQRVILKGSFSPKLVHELTPLILEDQPHLIIITEDSNTFSYFKLTEIWVDRLHFMEKHYGQGDWLKQCQPEESIAEMSARYHCWLRNKDELSTSHAWQGMLSLEKCHKQPSTLPWDNEQLCAQRGHLVRQVLENQPYVYIAGISGVGKSTFIKYQFIEEEEELFIHESPQSIDNWIISQAKMAILFIDEANLSLSQFSQFEGLFLAKPAIFHNGEYHMLSEKHKVIFAGNPLNYGDERQFSRFFQRHGNAIIFEPLPLSIIEADILNPIMKDKKPELSAAILTLYSQLCELSINELLISPREIQTLALWAIQGDTNIDTLNYFIYHMLKNMLNTVDFFRYCQKLNPQSPDLKEIQLNFENHLILPSRFPTIILLIEQLKLQQSRYLKKLKGALQCYGGLGGILIEGPVGLGKTELVKNILEQFQIEYINLSASMSVDEKEKTLNHAFYNGEIVWMDELNTSPVLEKLLNALLMGKTPSGASPRRPGFMIIATQNPSNMLGRRQISPALLRRLLILKVDEYTIDEMVTIFKYRGMNEDDSLDLALAYQRLKGQVSFRDTLKLMPKTSNEKKRKIVSIFDNSSKRRPDEPGYDSDYSMG